MRSILDDIFDDKPKTVKTTTTEPIVVILQDGTTKIVFVTK